MIKAILFDFDSTLVDYRYGDYLAIQNVKESCIHSVDSNSFYKESKRILNLIYEKPQIANIDINELRIKSLLSSYDIEYEAKHLEKYYSVYLNTVLVYEGVLDFLEKAKSIYKLGLLTNSIDGNIQRKRINASQLERYFSKIGVANEIGYWKPDVESFQWLANELCIDNNECVFVGDNEILDIQGAKNAGMYTIKRNRKDKEVEPTIADKSFDEYSELQILINEIA